MTPDTIVAVATPPGRGGIGVVRIAGPDATRIAGALLARDEPLQPRHATFARLIDAVPSVPGVPSVTRVPPDPSTPSAPSLDHVVATWFAAPHSYTGDDVVELATHGNPVILRRVVELAIAAGARLAEPGEFTLRAYLNGRVDLIQAEAVADLVAAVTPLQARAAMDQLEGTLTTAIGEVDATLFDLAARLEASLDFPDEGFHFVTREAAIEELARVDQALGELERQGRVGRVIREGQIVVIAGRPNAGKSSLFNALVGAARAIVTDVPGTTRDVLTERVDIGGIPVTLVDTAGLRDARDAIEAEGVRRAQDARSIAAVTVLVFDGGSPVTDDDDPLLGTETTIVVANKMDLPRQWSPAGPRWDGRPIIGVSATRGDGIDALRAAIATALTGEESLRDAPAITNVRHLTLVSRARETVSAAREQLAAGATEELVLADLQTARHALEEITGRRSADDLLQHIFGKFCVGK